MSQQTSARRDRSKPKLERVIPFWILDFGFWIGNVLPVGNLRSSNAARLNPNGINKAKQKIYGFLLLPFYFLLAEGGAFAQLVPDTTLGSESSIVTPSVLINNRQSDRIDGGAFRGANLFHSFLQFNINPGQRIYFSSPAGIENILTRVTGANPSNILGTLGVNGEANLFLINPNGILFGTTARLDVKGSFFASTASSIVFSDRNQFSANLSESSPLLTVSAPSGVQFGSNPGAIRVQGANLVTPGKTLALVGGEVTLQGGRVSAPSGRVELGGVAGMGLVNLNQTANGWVLSYPGVQNFQDVQLSERATVDVSGARGGDIQVQARSLRLREDSRLTALTLGSQPGGMLTVNAMESVELTGTGKYVEDTIKFSTGTIQPESLRNGLFTASFGTGAAGDVVINTPAFSASNGAFIATSTFGPGKGGHLTVNASRSVDLKASSLLTGTGNTGDAGNLTINTQRFSAADNATLTTASLGAGRAGNLNVNAAESVQLTGSNPVSIPPNTRLLTGFYSSTLATGNAGNLQVVTGRLEVLEGAAIAANTFGKGQGGDVSVKASESVELIGSSPDGQALSALSNGTSGAGKGGNLTVETNRLLLQDGGRLSVRSRETGDAGDIKVVANSIDMDNGGSIAAATTVAGEGGNVRLETQSLQLRRNSIISAEAGGSGNGGNISIDTDVVVALENSNITANAYEGNGGNIKINSLGFFIAPNSKITASSTLGINGVVNINTEVNDVQGSLAPLEEEFVSPDQLVADSCLARRNFERGSFTVTGTGGLPSTPYGAFTGSYAVTDVEAISSRSSAVRSDRDSVEESKVNRLENSTIQEAQGMSAGADGRVILGTNRQLMAVESAEKLTCNL
ncbi:filamentous hemagglutinin N-terminal domain-containing protein [Microcoleus sp. FACHB-831]|uniref:two-partner secretion domain-containing protein n=1 Tax=Microcoleus sp. FACHB-831 TaxID=2692827 RepID=UPI0016849356|nr:filamentous hemagglutinin N-terminal domain-containing protein [Microcoleus sp. FACHB-831]MBD1920273.1 filamentous hemagglutinin N-terminal domain-containing protein [Microcoleus sp. FACHB-831]